MSFEDISIYRDFPVINDFVQVPPNRERDKTAVTLEAALSDIVGSTRGEATQGVGKGTGLKTGRQRWLRLPALNAGVCCDRITPEPAADLLS